MFFVLFVLRTHLHALQINTEKLLYVHPIHIHHPKGMTPLIVACGGGHSETAQLLIEEGADLSKLDWVCH